MPDCRPLDISDACLGLRTSGDGRVGEDVSVTITETELPAGW